GSERRFLATLPVRKIPGIGEVTERALRALGIETVEQIAAMPQEKLESIFGQWGTALYRKSRGGDSYEFVIDAEPKSISHNHTFGEDTDDVDSLSAMLSHLSQKACKRLRETGLATRTLTLTARYATTNPVTIETIRNFQRIATECPILYLPRTIIDERFPHARCQHSSSTASRNGSLAPLLAARQRRPAA